MLLQLLYLLLLLLDHAVCVVRCVRLRMLRILLLRIHRLRISVRRLLQLWLLLIRRLLLLLRRLLQLLLLMIRRPLLLLLIIRRLLLLLRLLLRPRRGERWSSAARAISAHIWGGYGPIVINSILTEVVLLTAVLRTAAAVI